MPLHLYDDIYQSGSVPPDWRPDKGGALKYPVRNRTLMAYLRQLLPGRWQKVIKFARPAKYPTLSMRRER